MSIEVAIRHRQGAFALDAAFAIERPGITALFGSSGSGKTTAINAIAGLFKPDDGTIVIDGHTVLDTKKRVFVPARARRIGYVFQDARLFPHLSVRDNLLFGWRRRGKKDSTLMDEIVGLLALEPLLDRNPSRLSGGEQSRTALGRALLSDPALLLLDEPLAALDAARKAEILPFLEGLRGRLPMVYVTHSLDELARLADDVVVLNDGRVTRRASVFDLFADLEFSKLTGIVSHSAVLRATVARQLAGERLTVLAFDGGELVVPATPHGEGTHLRIRIRAEDVLLSMDAPERISANNVLAAQVTGILAADGPYADVQLDCGGVKLLSRITRASLARLAIVPGTFLHAIIKSVTIDPRG